MWCYEARCTHPELVPSALRPSDDQTYPPQANKRDLHRQQQVSFEEMKMWTEVCLRVAFICSSSHIVCSVSQSPPAPPPRPPPRLENGFYDLPAFFFGQFPPFDRKTYMPSVEIH